MTYYVRMDPWKRHRRVISLLGVLLLLPMPVRLLLDYTCLIPGRFGFEWTERYGSTVTASTTS